MFLEIFKRLQVNVLFLEALKQMPTFAKFVKEIVTKKIFIEQDTIQLLARCLFPKGFATKTLRSRQLHHSNNYWRSQGGEIFT